MSYRQDNWISSNATWCSGRDEDFPGSWNSTFTAVNIVLFIFQSYENSCDNGMDFSIAF